MSAIFGDLPRKPITDAEREQNNRNRINAQHAEALYSTGEAALRKRIEEELVVAFEADSEGHWYVDNRKIEGEYDFERFTPAQWDTYNLYRHVAVQIIERMTIVWPEVTPRGITPKVVRWAQRIGGES